MNPASAPRFALPWLALGIAFLAITRQPVFLTVGLAFIAIGLARRSMDGRLAR